MISLIRKLPVAQILRPLLTANTATASSSPFNGGRHIFTGENAQNSEHMTKTDKIGGVPNEMKTTLRTLSTLNQSMPLAVRAGVSKDERTEFMALFPDLVRELTDMATVSNVKEVAHWFDKVLQYNVPHGKQNRGLLTVLAYKKLVGEDKQTPENIKMAQYLGWCIELLQGMFLVTDDIMDESTTRRGQLCWYKVEDVGLTAINDFAMTENATYLVLRNHFRHLDCYVDILDTFHKVVFLTTSGQALDQITSKQSVTTFTMDKYNAIVENKSAYFIFYFPFSLAMHLAGFKDSEALRQAKEILLEMGNFYQVQDDFLDCFGNPGVTGKIGTDIQDNKCSWLAAVCMQRANEEQKKIMVECYGHKDLVKVARVKQLYKELGLPNIYAIYEKHSYNIIKTHIQQISRGVLHELLFQILNMTYHRDR